MRKYLLLHVLIISFVFFLTPTIQAASDVEVAIEEYKQAVKINPDSATAHFNLGLGYVVLKDKDSALEQYKILISLDPILANELFNLMYK